MGTRTRNAFVIPEIIIGFYLAHHYDTAGFTIFPTFVALVHKKTYVECTKDVRRNTPAGLLPPTTNHKQENHGRTLADFADFGTTISNSFLGQISYLRQGNPLRASAPATQ